MKQIRLTALIILMTGYGVQAQNSIDGNWVGSASGPNGNFEVTYQFKSENETLSGSVTSPMGASEIRNGSINGKSISFDLSFRDMTISHTGEITGPDELVVKNPMAEMTLKRSEATKSEGNAGFVPPVEEIGYGKVSGTVRDNETGEAIPFATIALLDEDGDIKDGTIADENGRFSIRSVPSGNYKIAVSFIGYEELKQNSILITGKGESYDLGNLNLKTVATELDEVVVTGQRDLIEEKVDRIVYNAEQDETTAGGDAVDVLRRVPLLSVDLDGNVTLRGSSNLKVLIDNRPSTISANSIGDALKQIPADQIKSVEVITSPTARYDAEGTGGIINIITKKNNLQGASLNLRSSAGLRGSNLGLNAGLRKGRTGFTLGGFGRVGYNIVGEFENDQNFMDEQGNVTSSTYQRAETLNNMMFGRYNLGWDYEINKYNWIGANVSFGLFNFNNQQDNRLSQTYQGSSLINENLQDVTTLNHSEQFDVNLNFIRSFEEKGKEFSILSLYSQNNRTNDFETETLNLDNEEIASRLKNVNDSYNRELTVQVDYVEPLGEKQIIEVGAKNIMRSVISDYQYFQGQGTDPYEQVNNPQFTNQLNYTQNVSAGYLSYSADFLKDYSAKIGGRYEYTTIEGLFEDEVPLDIPSYGVFVPSINLSRKLGQGKTLKVAYNQRIQRPSLQFLNPNIQASNPKDITQGNPLLDPEYTHNYEISYSTFKQGMSINVSAFMRNTEGSIQPVREPIGQDTVLTTYRNIGEEDAYGLSLFANFRFGDKVMLNGGLDGYYAVIDNNVSDPLYNASNEGFVLSGRMFGSYKFTEQWAFQFFGFFRGKQVQLQGHQTGFYVYSLSLNKSFNDDKGSIGIGAENFLSSPMKMERVLSSAFIDQTNTNYMYNTNIKINFTYRIGKLSTSTRKRRKSISNDDMKEGENNNMNY